MLGIIFVELIHTLQDYVFPLQVRAIVGLVEGSWSEGISMNC